MHTLYVWLVRPGDTVRKLIHTDRDRPTLQDRVPCPSRLCMQTNLNARDDRSAIGPKPSVPMKKVKRSTAVVRAALMCHRPSPSQHTHKCACRGRDGTDAADRIANGSSFQLAGEASSQTRSALSKIASEPEPSGTVSAVALGSGRLSPLHIGN